MPPSTSPCHAPPRTSWTTWTPRPWSPRAACWSPRAPTCPAPPRLSTPSTSAASSSPLPRPPTPAGWPSAAWRCRRTARGCAGPARKWTPGSRPSCTTSTRAASIPLRNTAFPYRPGPTSPALSRLPRACWPRVWSERPWAPPPRGTAWALWLSCKNLIQGRQIRPAKGRGPRRGSRHLDRHQEPQESCRTTKSRHNLPQGFSLPFFPASHSFAFPLLSRPGRIY
mmetsp:Transcript_19807/g.55057  ORF Transcript_19807/g.55057 Transcript_19807/m.55057 type:complete len:225 (+) Transcript_19807:1613-2287(+)